MVLHLLNLPPACFSTSDISYLASCSVSIKRSLLLAVLDSFSLSHLCALCLFYLGLQQLPSLLVKGLPFCISSLSSRSSSSAKLFLPQHNFTLSGFIAPLSTFVIFTFVIPVYIYLQSNLTNFSGGSKPIYTLLFCVVSLGMNPTMDFLVHWRLPTFSMQSDNGRKDFLVWLERTWVYNRFSLVKK